MLTKKRVLYETGAPSVSVSHPKALDQNGGRLPRVLPVTRVVAHGYDHMQPQIP